MSQNIEKIINKAIIVLTIIGLFIIVSLYIKVPYEITTTGGLFNLKEKIKVDDYNCSGEYNMIYVNELDNNLLMYLVALINPNLDITEITDDNIDKNTPDDEIEYRGKALLKYSNDIAILEAYRLAGKKLEINNSKFAIIYVDKNSDTNLKVKDEIISINGIKIKNYEDIPNLLKSFKVGDKVIIEVNNNKKIYKREAILNDENKIGVFVLPIYDFNSDIEFDFKKNETGSSGGMMMTLALYDYLSDIDLAKGRIIAGTGTIEPDGEIGEISGLKYKLKTAVENDVDLFLVSKYNYKEAIKLKKKNNYNIEIVEVDNIEDAIKYLKK